MWVHMNTTYPQAPTPESLEGDAAHWVCWQRMEGAKVAAGMAAPNGAIVTEEMLDGAEVMAEAYAARTAGWGKAPVIEVPVGIPSVHAQCWGTPDLREYHEAGATLELLDYKFGHRYVDEFENWQLIAYAIGIINEMALNSGRPLTEFNWSMKINLTVVQPRCYYRGAPVRTWSIVAADLQDYARTLKEAAAAAMSGNPTATTNSECCDCPGRHACPALQKAAYSDAEFSERSTPLELSPEAASLELRMLERAYERLGARVDGLRETVTAYARSGRPVPFHTLKQGYGRQQWTVPPEQVIALGSLYGADLRKPAVLTPKQAEAAGVDGAVIKHYSITPVGKLTLVAENPTDARRVFGINKEQ